SAMWVGVMQVHPTATIFVVAVLAVAVMECKMANLYAKARINAALSYCRFEHHSLVNV
ncbi:unnamed protein product, partial [Ceratitis capitata]